MALVNIDDFAAYLKRDRAALDADSAQLMLDGAAAMVAEYCGWHIAPSITESISLDGSGTRIQPLPTLNLTDLHTVAENGVSLDVNQIDWSANGIMEKRSGRPWSARRRGVVVSIAHGYPVTPGWVNTLICAVAGRALLTPLGVLSETAGAESITYTAPRLPVMNVAPPGTVILLDPEMRMLDRIALPQAA